jgi:hypothetical protein
MMKIGAVNRKSMVYEFDDTPSKTIPYEWKLSGECYRLMLESEIFGSPEEDTDVPL